MIEAITYESMIYQLSSKYMKRRKTFGILLVKPNNKPVSNEILGNLSYLHHRSNNNLDIFLSGYGAYWGDSVPDSKNVCKIDNVEWSFSSKCFNDFITELEKNSSFKYRGGSELILLDYINSKIDFKNVVRVKLDKALEDKAIFSVEELLEEIISKFVKSTSSYRISDTFTLKELGKSISSELSRFSVIRIFKRSRHFTIFNYEKGNK